MKREPPIDQNEWDDYRNWLVTICQFNDRNYKRLIDHLHNTPFEYILKRDKDREMDGLYLRRRYESITETNCSFDSVKPCGVLEMLVALAIRIDDEYIGSPFEPHPEIPFKEMLDNLDLYPVYDDRCYNEHRVDCNIRLWLRREFFSSGHGSTFPLRHPTCDQTNIPIWSQMMAYISENYG